MHTTGRHSDPADAGASSGGPTRRAAPRWLVVSSLAALAWLIVARVAGPTDLWEQAQRNTISYTTDIILYGRWVLPLERGQVPATKPPLYNWIAVPAVMTLGFSSEIAHKLPSVLAVTLTWLVLVRRGRRLDPAADGLGWMAGLVLVSSYPIFKLGYLARPDMMLVLWTTLGWMTATQVLVSTDNDRDGVRRGDGLVVLVFWICTAMAGLTKGPAALVLVLYALVAAKPLGGSWKAVHRLRWWWGAPLALAPITAWVLGAWMIDADHVRDQLWGNEIWGRLTGRGPEGSAEKHADWLTGLPYMPFYFLMRFLPWSLLCVPAMVYLVLRRRGQPSNWRRLDRGPDRGLGGWLAGAALFVLVVLVMFSVSTGKRADYLAPALPAAALLTAWWLLRCPLFEPGRLRWMGPALALVALASLTAVNVRQPTAPAPGFSRSIERFIADAARAIDAHPDRPVLFCWTGAHPVQALLGGSQRNGENFVVPMCDAGEPFLVVTGEPASEPRRLIGWLRKRRPEAEVRVLVESATLPKSDRWNQQNRLYLVRPAPAPGSDRPDP